jgi:hypothetical protein
MGGDPRRSCLVFPDMNVVVCIRFSLGEFSRRSIQGARVTDRSDSGLALLDSLMYSDKSSLHLHLSLLKREVKL